MKPLWRLFGKNRTEADLRPGPDAAPEPAAEAEPGAWWPLVARGVAAFLGFVCLLDVICRTGASGADFGWIDFSPLSTELAHGLLAFIGVALLMFAIVPRLPWHVRLLVLFGVMALASVAVSNAISVHRSIRSAELPEGIPMAAHIVALLIPVVCALTLATPMARLRLPITMLLVCGSFVGAGAAFSLGYMSALCKSHRALPADVIVLVPSDENTVTVDQWASVVSDLVDRGIGGHVLVADMSGAGESLVEPLQELLPEGVPIETVAAASEPELLSAVASSWNSAVLVGEIRISARWRLLARRYGSFTRFVPATPPGPLDSTAMDEARRFWGEWLTWPAEPTSQVPVVRMQSRTPAD